MSDSRPDFSDPRDYILDLSTHHERKQDSPANSEESCVPASQAAPVPSKDRPVASLSVLFKCCSVYAAIYKNAAQTAYVGHCPRCSKPIRIPIGPGGSSSRIFIAE